MHYIIILAMPEIMAKLTSVTTKGYMFTPNPSMFSVR